MQLKAATGIFFIEFSKFETVLIGRALRSLSKDSGFVEQTEKMLDLESRLTLLRRMALARGISAATMAELDACLTGIRKLRDQRDEVARSLNTVEDTIQRKVKAPTRRSADLVKLAQMEHLLLPGSPQIRELATETVELQETLRTIVDTIEQQTNAAQPA